MGHIITKFDKYNEGQVAGSMIDPGTQVIIMTVIPAIVAALLGHTYKEEIKEWLENNMAKAVELFIKHKPKNMGATNEVYVSGTEVDASTMTAIMAIVPILVSLVFGHEFKDEIKSWMVKKVDVVKNIISRKLVGHEHGRKVVN